MELGSQLRGAINGGWCELHLQSQVVSSKYATLSLLYVYIAYQKRGLRHLRAEVYASSENLKSLTLSAPDKLISSLFFFSAITVQLETDPPQDT